MAFTKAEHVIPQSFGVFKNNLTLIDLVCDDCNQLFGNTLELALARDTIEGALRFEHQLKETRDYKSVGKESRIAIQIPDGELKGMWGYRKYSPEHKRIMLIPLPQVGFLKGTSREYFLLDALPSKEQLLKEYNFAHPQAVHYIGCDPTTADDILKKHGINVRDCEQPSFADSNEVQTIECELEATIDQTILRAMAKIGFNYFTYWQKDFVLHEDFNPIRKFILSGELAQYPLIRIDQSSVLKDEPIQGKRRSGHLITVDWAADGTSILAQVSLMNHLKYVISIARNFRGEHRDIRKGHFFNFHSKTISPLTTNPDEASIIE
ncbi:MAG: HNH endonuclease [Desulfobulbaceae bacterium]|nr:HNH endonuclease [Desulfobulbaceae bacterium]